ncbi:MAG: cytochrome c-type biogenesis protein CcmH [Gemmatimonadota bacterium]
MTGTSARRTVRLGVLTALFSLSSGAPLSAQGAFFGGGSSSVAAADSARDAELDAMTASIASKLRCPVCRGQSVQESSAQLAREMQALIRQKLETGETPDEIEAFFVASYGDFILLKPRARGLGALVYVLPAVAFLLGLVTIGFRLRPANGSRGLVGAETVDRSAAASATAGTDFELPPEDRRWLDAAIRGDS